jgi:hypothetical protein
VESQKTEWKRQWSDDFLKGLYWLANAKGSIERITTTCKDAGKPEPKIDASASEISVTFFTDANIVENGGSIGEKFAEKCVEESAEGATNGIGNEFSIKVRRKRK